MCERNNTLLGEGCPVGEERAGNAEEVQKQEVRSKSAGSGPRPLRNSMASGLVGCEFIRDTEMQLLTSWYCIRKGKQLMGLFNEAMAIPEAPPHP